VLVNQLLEILKEIWGWLNPLHVVDEFERGVLIRNGRIKNAALAPGLKWRWWWEQIENEPIVDRTFDLPTVYVKTARGTRAVSANMVTQTFDPVLMWRRVFDHQDSATRRAAGVLALWAKDPNADVRRLKRQINSALRPWGIKVKHVDLTTDVYLRMTGHMVEGSGVTIN
jgi:regulator of protease activity HflC (stomatin/prohibitin superfamily)